MTWPKEPQKKDPDHEVILEYRGLKITLTLARLFAGFWLTVFFALGCFWILIGNSTNIEDQAAIAILSSVVTTWITALSRAR
jgi:hypothetical protein